MKSISCPHCSSPAKSVTGMDGRKYYCARCGWNLGIVQAELSSSSKISLIIVAIGLVLALFLYFRNPSEWSTPLLILFLFDGLPVYHTLSSSYQLRNLKNLALSPALSQTNTVTISEFENSSNVPSKTASFKAVVYA